MLSFLKYVARGTSSIAMGNVAPAAKAYMHKTVDNTVDALPATAGLFVKAASLYYMPAKLAMAAKAYDLYEQGLSFDTAKRAAKSVVQDLSTAKEVLLAPARALHHRRNYQFLKGEQAVAFTANDNDEECIITIARAGI